jgi:LysR family transcriptional regulator, glycine cleavage system transcriptional activator
MRIRSPSLPELHAFVAVVEAGGFSRAAARLSVTQGAVSRAVLRLEERLGLALLERGAGGARPTADGRAYYARIHTALATLEEAVPARRRAADEQELRVAAISSLNMRWLVPRLPRLYAEHPWLHIAFKPYWKDEDFRRDDVDCWIQTRLSGTSRWPRHIRATYIVGREIVPICPPALARRLRTPADLLQHPLLHHATYPGNWSLWWDRHGDGSRLPKLGAGFDLAVGMIEAVAAGMGIAVVQRCLIERELADGRVHQPFDLQASTGRGYHLCVPRAGAGTPALEAFEAWLLAQAASG